MRNAVARTVCRLVATVAAAAALYRYAWLPAYADHVLKSVTTRSEAALQMSGNQAVFAARDNLERLQAIAAACRLSVAFHLVYAVNARILGRNDDAIEHYTAALAVDQRPEIYFDRGTTYLDEKKLDAAIADVAMAVRFNPVYLESVDAEMRERVTAFNKSVPYNPPPR
jgi:tetratricopeptide (TPR) repeat protein